MGGMSDARRRLAVAPSPQPLPRWGGGEVRRGPSWRPFLSRLLAVESLLATDAAGVGEIAVEREGDVADQRVDGVVKRLDRAARRDTWANASSSCASPVTSIIRWNSGSCAGPSRACAASDGSP